MARQNEDSVGTQREAALGGQLGANDRWLVSNILSADSWAEGTAADLLDGSAWHRFTDRLSRLAERIQGANAPSSATDTADGYRYLSMLVRNAFDVAIEEIDPALPRIHWLTRRNKIGFDCADALYAYAAIRDDMAYRIRGRRGSVHFLGLQVMASIRSLHNTHADELEIAPDGTFEIMASRAPQKGNWLPLGQGADTIWIRQFFYDWERERPAVLTIDLVDGEARSSHPPRFDAASFARRLDAVATNVEANVDLWLAVAVAQRQQHRNAFPAEAFGGTTIGGQKHQTAGTGYFSLREDEALLIEVRPPRAKYWSIHLCNFWLESLDYASHQSSLNGHQAVLDSDGMARLVVSPCDPGVANWLDTVGHAEGTMIYRWNLADAAPVPSTRVVPLAELSRVLPSDTRRVTDEERSRTVAMRREHVRRRTSRPL